MPDSTGHWDAVIIGSGPNGLAAGITLARAGLEVLIIEGRDEIGGGLRSAALTLPGYVHDVCSAVHPLGLASPFMKSLPLASFGLEWCHPQLPAAHPLDGGRAGLQYQDLEKTAEGLGIDGAAWKKALGPLVAVADDLFEDLLGPAPIPPRHLGAMMKFGLQAWQSALGWAQRFRTDEAQALFAGHAGHSWLRLDQPFTAAVGIMLSVSAHAVGWPVARGGSGEFAKALLAYYQHLGGRVETGQWIKSFGDLPPASTYLFDTSPQAMASICGDVLPSGYSDRLRRYRHGPAAWKLDLALDGPIPWTHPSCAQAGTVHIGGTAEEIAQAEAACWRGEIPERPFILLGQQSMADPSRAPVGKQTVWLYGHVPSGCSDPSTTERLLSQVERFAPGFRERILATHITTPRDFESINPNNIGGDIIGGVQDLGQMFTRPVARLDPYTTPHPRVFLCSASTPPGAGVHGMCGWWAAKSVLKRVFGQH